MTKPKSHRPAVVDQLYALRRLELAAEAGLLNKHVPSSLPDVPLAVAITDAIRRIRTLFAGEFQIDPQALSEDTRCGGCGEWTRSGIRRPDSFTRQWHPACADCWAGGWKPGA